MNNVTFKPEHDAIHELALTFANERLEAAAQDMDRTERFPLDIYKELGELGFLGMTAPPEIGGAAADIVAWAKAIEAISRTCPQMGDMMMLAKEMVDYLLVYGGPVHAEIATAIASGDLICAIAITEPGGGSDVAGIRTRAERVDGGYRLFGSKRFITAAGVADRAIVLARTSADGGHKSLTAFLVDTKSRGFSVARKEDLMGMRGMATAEIAFDDVFVPDEGRLGAEGEGFKCMMRTLDVGRIGVAAMSVGIAQGALEAALDYARQREQFGRTIGEYQGIQFMLADMDVRTESARRLVMHAAELHAAGQSVRLEAVRAKLAASDAAVAVASDAVQIHGGVGYSRGVRVERLYRDAKVQQIWEGTNQIMRSVIARLIMAN